MSADRQNAKMDHNFFHGDVDFPSCLPRFSEATRNLKRTTVIEISIECWESRCDAGAVGVQLLSWFVRIVLPRQN